MKLEVVQILLFLDSVNYFARLVDLNPVSAVGAVGPPEVVRDGGNQPR